MYVKGLKKIWEQVKLHLSEVLPSNLFQIWINPLQLLGKEGGQILLGCPNQFFLQWVKTHFLHHLEEAWRQYLPECKEVVLKIIKNEKTENKTIIIQSLPLVLPRPRLCKEFTFDEFVVGKCNQYAYATACNLVNGHLNHPIFFYSDIGLGKTHIAQAIAHYILNEKKETRVFYLTAEDFTNQMVKALKEHSINEFKEKYRQECDVFILENIHFLAGKEKIQSELAYTLDVLWEMRKKIVFTGITYPQKIPALKKELKSRMESGLIVPIDPPDQETRFKILKKKAQKQPLSVPEDILAFLAQRIEGDIRRLESALSNLTARALLQKRPLNLDLAKEVVSIFAETKPKINIKKIQSLVCQYYHLNLEELLSSSRKKQVALPRKIAIYLAKQYLNLSLSELGKIFHRHHATILNALHTIEKEIKKQGQLAHEIEYLCQKLEED